MRERFLEFTQLGKSYDTPHGPAVIVKDFNLRMHEGEFVCIIGHSGCGKSTVLSIVMGLNEPTEGGVILGGREISGPGTDRGVVFQSPALLPWCTARDNVLLAVQQVKGGQRRSAQRRLAEHYLGLVGLAEVGDCYPNELSAGMRQRVGIARAFALEPKVLLLDEPFSLLDALTRMELQDELMRLWDEDRKTVVMVTHDVDEASAPGRPCGHDDQRPRRDSRGDPHSAFPTPALPCGSAQSSQLLPVTRPAHRLFGRACCSVKRSGR